MTFYVKIACPIDNGTQIPPDQTHTILVKYGNNTAQTGSFLNPNWKDLELGILELWISRSTIESVTRLKSNKCPIWKTNGQIVRSTNERTKIFRISKIKILSRLCSIKKSPAQIQFKKKIWMDNNVNLSKFVSIWSSDSIPIINIILNNASAVAITVITTPACIKCTTWIKIY